MICIQNAYEKWHKQCAITHILTMVLHCTIDINVGNVINISPMERDQFLSQRTLTKCTLYTLGGSSSVSTLRPVVPSSRAVYLHTLKSCSGAFLGEILSVAFMPNGDPVVLTSTGKKVRNATIFLWGGGGRSG